MLSFEKYARVSETSITYRSIEWELFDEIELALWRGERRGYSVKMLVYAEAVKVLKNLVWCER